jgi:D-alanyl-D-alanine carboxypeptidase
MAARVRMPAEEDLRSLLRKRLGDGPAGALAVRLDDDEQREVAINIPEDQRPASGPIFLAYSITKSFIATLVLQLCAEGPLGLDQPLAHWFPQVPRGSEIPLRALLNHTGGIPDYRSLGEYHRAVAASPSTPWSFDEFAAHTYAKGLAFPPGEGWDYSNPGYMLLRRVVEVATGESLPRLLARRILGPLDLRHTFVA